MAKKPKGSSEEEDGGPTVTFTFRAPRPLMDAFARYCQSQRFPPSKQTVLERLLEKLLEEEGFWPKETAEPEVESK